MRFSLSPSRQRQQGAFSIMAAATLLMSLLFLVLVLDSGRLYLEQRHLQKIADTAALESISRVENGSCYSDAANADKYAKENAERYDFPASSEQSIEAKCVTVTSVNGLRQTTPDSEYGRAVQVTTFNTVPVSLVIKAQSLLKDIPEKIKLSATAVAEREEPTAVFTVGSQLLRLENNLLLGQLLKVVGVNPEHLTVLDADGLANVTITPSGLLHALNIDVGIHQLKALSSQGLIDLVDTKVGLLGIDELLKASAEIVSDSVLGVDLDLLRQDILSSPQLKNININLLGDEDRSGLLQLVSNTSEPLGSALDARINLGEIISTALLIGVHESGRGLLVPGLNLLGQKIELGIVEPPSIGIGPVGTTAYNAQIRLYVDVDTNNLLGGILKWLTDTILGTRIHLPIWIDLISGHGTLNKISCEGITPTVDIAVESDILNACVGEIPDDLKWSTSASCESNLQELQLIKLLHAPILSGKTHIPALRHDDDLLDMIAGSTVSTSPNKLALGDTVEGIVDGLLDLLSGLFRKPNAVSGNSNLEYSEEAQKMVLENLVEQYLEETSEAKTYNIENVSKLILEGGDKRDEDGKQVLPPLVDSDWFIPNSIPTTCLIITCPPSQWRDGTFTQALDAYSKPHSLLGSILPSAGKGYRFCGNLVGALVDWNGCIKHNLVKLLQDKPGGINISNTADGLSITTPNEKVKCSGILCNLLKPVLLLVKPLLNAVGNLLNVILADILGIELGRTDVTVESINCGAPKLVR